MGKKAAHRPTIGLLIESTAGRGAWYRTAIWTGVADAARELDVNLLTFAGGALERSPFNEFEAQRNLVYDLVTQDSVDGLIISVSLGTYISPEEFKDFCEYYRSFLPTVTIGAPLPVIPGILADNQEGVREAMRHLIEAHTRQRIAFIKGPSDNPEAQARYEAYRQALTEFGLSLDPDLVVPGDFTYEAGSQAIDTLLDKRRGFNAVLAANDYMALGALERLKARGRRVPKDVAVVGFDGVEEGEASTPPLTTVRQPVRQQARRAVEMLLDLLAGKQVPPQVILPTEVVVRQSCGCAAPAVAQAAVGPMTRAGTGITPVAILTAKRETILAEIIQAVRVPSDEAMLKQVGQLLDALVAELKGEASGAFLSSLESTLHQVMTENGDVAAWQDAISVLRRHTLPYLAEERTSALAEDLWQEARVVIAEMAQREQAHRRLQAEQQAVTLREIGEAMITSVEMNGLMDVVAEALPRLGIPDCYVSLYEPDTGKAACSTELPGQNVEERPRIPAHSRLILAYGAGERQREVEGQVFPSHQLVPNGVLDHGRRYSMAVEPLHFREDQLGFALFEMGPREGAVYEALRGQVSSALQGALLVRQVQQGQEYLRSLYEASVNIISLQSPQTLLQDIVERTCRAAGACQADVVLVDKSGRFQRLARGQAGERVPTVSLYESMHISQEVIRTNEPILLEDVQDERQPAGQPLARAAVGAAGCFPLCSQGKPIGVMWIYYSERRRFSQAEIDALRLYVNQVAIAYDNARRMRELEHLRQAAEKLAGVTEVQAVLQQIAASAKEVLEADSTVIWSYDPDRSVFIPAELVAEGVEPKVLEKFREDVPQPGGTATIVIEKGYLAVSDVDAPEYAYLRPPGRGLREEIGVKAFQGIALQVEGRPLGVLYVNYRQPREVDKETRSTLEAFAYHAALALKKARLLEEVRRAHDTARVVAEASVLADLQRTLDAVAQGTLNAVGCDAVTLYVYNPATGKLDQPPAMAGVQYPDRTQLYEEVAQDSIVYEMLRQDKPYVVEVTAKDTLFRDRRFVKDEQIESCVAVPLQAAGHRVGVMFVNYRTRHRFTGEELADIELFAHQAAAAIRNTQLYEEATRRAKALESLYEAGKTVTSTLALNEILTHIVEQASLLTAHSGEQARLCYLALKEDGKLRFTATYPPDHLPGQTEYIIDLEHDERIGISGRAVKTGQSQLVGDVTRDPDYIGDTETRSELAVPIKWGDRVIGVIDLEHPKRHVFDREDQRWLELLAAQAAIAIQNARQYEELTRTKGMVGARTALAWIGMTSAAWRHTIGNRAVTIAEQVDLLRKDLLPIVAENKYPRIYERMSMIQHLARQINERPIISPLSAEEGALSVPLNALIRERAKQLWQSDPYRTAALELNLTLDDKATVRASPEWLRRALDILIDNAIDAMADSPHRQLTIETRQKGNQAEILVRDTGKGIPPEVFPHLFVDPIEKPIGTKGLGIGLLMAQVIVQTYRGEIGIETTGPTGTTMSIRLPLEVQV